MADAINNNNNNVIIADIPRDYRSTWGNELEMDYATPNDYSDELRWRLQQNDPTVQVMRFPRWWEANDGDFAQLGDALKQNTHLKSLRLDFSPTTTTVPASDTTNDTTGAVPVPARLTTRGMEALTEGIRHSQVKYLMLDGVCPPQVQRSLFQGIWQSTTIRVISFVSQQVNVLAILDLLSPLTIRMMKTGPALPFHLRELSFRECEFTDEEFMKLSMGLGANRSIKSLALYNCSLTDQHIAAFCANWEQTSIMEDLDMRGNQITATGAEHLIEAAGKHRFMNRMAFSENRLIGYEGYKRLGRGIFATTNMLGFCCCSAVPVDYRDIPMPVRDEAFAAVAEGLRRNKNFNFLILRDNGMGPLGAQAILRGIANHPNFSDLGLNKNEEIGYVGLRLIGDELANAGLEDLNLESCVDRETKASQPEARTEACQALADGLRNNPSIKELKLGDNGIDSIGAQLLIQGIINHPSMTKLSLIQNPAIGHEGLKWIGQELPNLRLEELDLTDCTKGASDSQLQDSKLANEAGQALVDGVKRNVHIRQLHLSETDLNAKWRTELEFYLDLNRCGRYIMQADNVPLSLWCDVFDYLEDDVSQMYYFLKEQPWLVVPPPPAAACTTPSSEQGSRKRKCMDPL